MKYQIITDIIEKAENFYQQYGREPVNSEELIRWAYSSLAEHTSLRSIQTIEVSDSDTQESVIARLVSLTYRYAKHYVRKALEDSPLTSVDDFSYMAPLVFRPYLTKTELIDMNIHEKTTGIEIIKRLVARQIIQEMPNPADGRSKILQITPTGKNVFFAVTRTMLMASDIIAGNLSFEEKQTLITLLQKLHVFHEPLFKDYRDESLDMMYGMVQDVRTLGESQA